MERKMVYERLDVERDYQDSRWTNDVNAIPDEEKSVAEWILYMEHHLNKAKEQVYYLNEYGALSEIRKVTALGVRTMEIHGCPSRQPIDNLANENTEVK